MTTRARAEEQKIKKSENHIWPFLLPALLLASLAVAATWKTTFADRVIARGDLLLYFYPLRSFASQAIREGTLPLWNPFTFMGAPFLANSQAGFFYPFNVLTAWLPPERAVLWQIPLHLAMASIGMFALAQKRLGLHRMAAFAAALAFGLGGYLGAQAEHFNQLQALSWLPWMLCCVLATNGLRASLWLALFIALQMFAGHTQSLYISLVTCGVVAAINLAWNFFDENRRSKDGKRSPVSRLPSRIFRLILFFAFAGVLGALLSAAQLLPTFELSRLGARSGGLTPQEVGAFSWRPWVLARALMPTYGDPLFPEYIAYLGAIGMALAALGALPTRENFSSRGWLLALSLVLMGLVLALGTAIPDVFNRTYKYLPGFALFRAQARWLIVFAMGASMFIGIGVQRLRAGLSLRGHIAWLIATLAIAGAWLGLLNWGYRNSPEAEYQSLPIYAVRVKWAMGGGGALLCILLARTRLGAGLAVMALLIELGVASQFQPYTRASDRQALTDLRPAIAHLINEYRANPDAGRVLSLSSLSFDPGDKLEQELIFTSTLTADELYDRIIATKQKEILSPNFSLWYRIPGVDGYDGGLLPTREYAQFVQPLIRPLPNGQARTVDGRLREFLDGVPSSEWLNRMGAQFVMADKTADVFVENVYYDVLFSQPFSTTHALALTRLYSSTTLGLLFSTTDTVSLRVEFAEGGSESITQTPTRAVPPNTPVQFGHIKLRWQGRKTPVALRIEATAPMQLRALSSIDENDGSFVSQFVQGEHDMRMIYSGDTKIYENLKYDASKTVRFSELERRFRDEPNSARYGLLLGALGTLLWIALWIALRHKARFRA